MYRHARVRGVHGDGQIVLQSGGGDEHQAVRLEPLVGANEAIGEDQQADCEQRQLRIQRVQAVKGEQGAGADDSG